MCWWLRRADVSLGHAALFALAGYTDGILVKAGTSQFVAGWPRSASTMPLRGVRGAGAPRLRHWFSHDHAGARADLWGHRLPLGRRHRRRQWRQSVKERPVPFGIDLASPAAFYFATLAVFCVAVAAMAIVVRSPFGAALRGTRDQPRRMAALGSGCGRSGSRLLVLRGSGPASRGCCSSTTTSSSVRRCGAATFRRSAADGDLRRQRHVFGPDLRRAARRGDEDVVSAYIVRGTWCWA